MRKFPHLFSCGKENGQVLLIVVLIMVVGLTVGLSVISRSITEIRTSSEEENSQKAFAAAEAGIEKALGREQVGQSSFNISEGIGVETKVDPQTPSSSFLLNDGNLVEKDEGIDIWVSSYPDYSTPVVAPYLGIYWGSTTDLNENCSAASELMPAAIEVITIIGPTSNPTVNRFAYDPCKAQRGNNFSPPHDSSNPGTFTIGGETFKYKTAQTPAASSNLVIRVIPLYKSTKIGVSTCSGITPPPLWSCLALPSQGKIVESTGTAGNTIRKVRVFQAYPKLSSEYFYTLLKPIQ